MVFLCVSPPPLLARSDYPRLLTRFSVEAQGRTLEELEWVYKQPNPVKASQRVEKVVQQVDGTVTEKIVDQTS